MSIFSKYVFHPIYSYISCVPVSVGSRFVGPAAEPRSSSLNQESASFCQPIIGLRNENNETIHIRKIRQQYKFQLSR